MVLTAVQVAKEEALLSEAATTTQCILSKIGDVITAPIEWRSTNASNSSAKTVEPIL
jgi:hypothetical protein